MPPDVSPEAFRQVMGCYATGIVVVTTRDHEGVPVGLTVDSFNSVSMSPPLVLWSLALSAPSLPVFRDCPAFVVNVLASDQLDVCRQFATSGTDKFAGIDWTPGIHDMPVLTGTVATIECMNHCQYDGGDHEIMLGRVISTQVSERQPLVYSRGNFAGIGPQL